MICLNTKISCIYIVTVCDSLVSTLQMFLLKELINDLIFKCIDLRGYICRFPLFGYLSI